MDTETISLIMLATSILSIFGSLIVIAVLLKNSDLRKKPISKILFYISISDLLGSVCTYGLAPDGSAMCIAQGFLTNVFHLSSVFWTTVLTYGLYAIVVMRAPSRESIYQHIFCWILPLFLTCMIYTTNRIGSTYEDVVGWCFVASRSDSVYWEVRFWNFMAFNFWILLSALVMVYFMIRIRIELSNAALAVNNLTANKESTVAQIKPNGIALQRKPSKAFKLLGRQAKPFRILGIRDGQVVSSSTHQKDHKVSKVWIYPCIVILTWTYFCIHDTVRNFNGYIPSELDWLLILPFLQGVFKGLAFYVIHPNFVHLLCDCSLKSRPSLTNAVSRNDLSIFSMQRMHTERRTTKHAIAVSERKTHNWV